MNTVKTTRDSVFLPWTQMFQSQRSKYYSKCIKKGNEAFESNLLQIFVSRHHVSFQFCPALTDLQMLGI